MKSKIYFENLDGLRFLSFVAIFLHHGLFTRFEVVENSQLFQTIKVLLKPSGLGVPFFFCLSGFLITYLLLKELQDFNKIDILKFYIRRALRIWPLYYAVIIFGFFIFPFLKELLGMPGHEETATLWKYLAFMGNFDQIQNGLPIGAGLGVTWSLSVEEQFYLFWPLLFVLCGKKYLFPLSLSLILFSYVCIYHFDLPYSHTLGSLSDLAIGATMAISVFKNQNFVDQLNKISKSIIFTLYLLGIIHLYTWTVYGFGLRIFASLFLGFIILEQTFCENSFYKMKNYKNISYLGTLTYGLYLIHTISNFITSNILKQVESTDNIPFISDLIIQPIFSFTLTLFLGYLSYNYFEIFFLRQKEKFKPK